LAASKRMLFNIGCAGFPPNTRLTACNRAKNVLLETTNFIYLFIM
jgi:hypothetical protein